MLETYGRYMLVASAGEYEWQSRNQTFMLVEGQGQVRAFAPIHGAYSQPQPGRWQSSAAFDFAESTYTYGWGKVTKPGIGQPWAKINDVSHLRQAIFVKEAGLWFVVDSMIAPDSAAHRYQQVWCFDHSFPKESVMAHAETGTVSTTDTGKPNLSIVQASPVPLHYQKYHAEGNASGQEKPKLEHLTMPALGWQALNHDGDVVPAVTLHAEWEGKGRQTILSALVPSRTEESPLISQERVVTADRVGLKLKLKDGRSVTCYAALTEQGFTLEGRIIHLTIATQKPGEDEHGLLLDAANTTGTEYVRRDATIKLTGPVRVPTGFRWVNKDSGDAPEYFDRWNPAAQEKTRSPKMGNAKSQQM